MSILHSTTLKVYKQCSITALTDDEKQRSRDHTRANFPTNFAPDDSLWFRESDRALAPFL